MDELALVGGHDGLMPAALDQRREPRRIAREAGQRVGVEHDRPPPGGPCERRRDELAQGRTDARARPKHDGAAPLVGEQRLEFAGVGEGGDHHGGQMGGIDRDRVGRARHADNAGAGAQSRAGGEPGRARVVAGAGEDQDRAARIFVARGVWARQRLAPDRRRIDEGLRRDGAKRGFGNANVDEPDRAGARATRLQEMAGLQPEEGDARARFDRGAANPAGFPVDSGGNVDREHAAPCMAEGVDPLDDRLRFAIDVAREPRAEQSVDHAVGSSEVNCRGGEDQALIASGGERGIAFQGVSTAEQAEFDRIAALAEQASRR